MARNSGKSWTDEDDKVLAQMTAYGSSPSTIAARLGRTPFAIECRQRSKDLVPPETVTKTYGEVYTATHVKEAFERINSTLKKETPMTTLYKVEQVTKVNGTEVDNVADDQLIQYIRELEKQATSLEEIEVASEAIHARIDELRDNAKAIAEILDSRQADK